MANSSDNDDNRDPFNGSPFGYVMVPLFILIFIGLTFTMICIRRRRRLRRGVGGSRAHPSPWTERYLAPDGHILGRPRRGGGGGGLSGNRWAPWGGTRSQEGLNELGEAPPPYDQKKNSVASNGTACELADLESGTRPPGYDQPAAPAPVITVDSRRTVHDW